MIEMPIVYFFPEEIQRQFYESEQIARRDSPKELEERIEKTAKLLDAQWKICYSIKKELEVYERELRKKKRVSKNIFKEVMK